MRKLLVVFLWMTPFLVQADVVTSRLFEMRVIVLPDVGIADSFDTGVQAFDANVVRFDIVTDNAVGSGGCVQDYSFDPSQAAMVNRLVPGENLRVVIQDTNVDARSTCMVRRVVDLD